jgi:hypothetical protein
MAVFGVAEQATPTLDANWHTRMSDFGGELARLMTERGARCSPPYRDGHPPTQLDRAQDEDLPTR